MKHLISISMYPLIAAGIVAGEWYGYEWAGNISLFVLWFFAAINFLCLLAKPEQVFLDRPKSILIINRINFLLCVGVAIAAGWFVVSVFMIISWGFLWAKKQSYMKKKVELAASE